MKTLLKIQIALWAALAAVTTASGQSAIVTIPAAAVTPWLVRFATDKHTARPACEWEMVVAKRNNFVCARRDADWPHYQRIVVTSVEVVPDNLKKPLSEKETEQLRSALAASLEREFGDSATREAGHTLNLRATITGVERSNVALNIASLVAIQAPLSFGSATTSYALSDAETGETLAELTLRGRGRVYDVIPSVRAVGHARKAVARAPKQVSKDIQALRSTSRSMREVAIGTAAGQ